MMPASGWRQDRAATLASAREKVVHTGRESAAGAPVAARHRRAMREDSDE